MNALETRPGGVAPSSDAHRRLFRWICTSNPFYILSAWLVCMGLRVSFGAQVHAVQTWALLGGMVGYTLLLAVTACLLVRYVGVWDDVRSIMLLVVLMILATSVMFDDVFTRDLTRGSACYLVGLAFAVAVSEGLLRGARLALPALFRVPYYLALGLFFVYPVVLAPLVDEPEGEALEWALFGFTSVAGLIALTLLPAVRRGREYVRGNGSPWRWAWYPWTLFGLLAFGVVARSPMLCWSMHHAGKAYGAEPFIFGGYFLAPFLLAVAVVLLEIGLVERSARVRLLALALPAVATVLAAVGHRQEFAYQEFLTHRFEWRLGASPLYLTLMASAVFYGYAALRRTPRAVEALCGALAVLAFVAPGTRDLRGVVAVRSEAILLIGLVQLAVGVWAGSPRRRQFGWACLAAAGTIALFRAGEVSPGWRALIVYHMISAGLLVLGATADDSLARLARSLGTWMLALAAFCVSAALPETDFGWRSWAYPPAVALVLLGYGWVVPSVAAALASALIGVAWTCAAGSWSYAATRRIVPGIDYIVIGLALFALAVVVSVAKGGRLQEPVDKTSDALV